MKRFILLTILFLTAIPYIYGQGTSEFFTKADAFFKKNVADGRVDYKSIKADSSSLDALIKMAKGITVSKDNAAEYQAFWINGYNLHVINAVVQNYPLKSPLDVVGFFDKTEREIGGENITLNDIENKLLRGNFPSEPRFHFVLVCAGLGCPPIIDQAYLPSTLDAQLEKQTKIAINDPDFIRVNKNKVKVSQIFEWYPKDFKQDGQDLVDFLNKYRSEPLPEKTKVSYYPYDWTLNETK